MRGKIQSGTCRYIISPPLHLTSINIVSFESFSGPSDGRSTARSLYIRERCASVKFRVNAKSSESAISVSINIPRVPRFVIIALQETPFAVQCELKFSHNKAQVRLRVYVCILRASYWDCIIYAKLMHKELTSEYIM